MRRRPGGTIGAVYVLTLFLARASTELAAGESRSHSYEPEYLNVSTLLYVTKIG